MIVLIGTGPMAVDYAKVLTALKKDFVVVGRGEKNAIQFKQQTGIDAIIGGIELFLQNNTDQISHAINAVGIDALYATTKTLLANGIKNILLEKPGVAYANEIVELAELAMYHNASVVLAYNRRFYASVIKAKKLIEQDGGVKSFHFEFTEWSHVIEQLTMKTNAELNNWFLGNSSHVIDLAFYLGGKPKELKAFVSGKNKVAWHPASSSYSGAGITENEALFSYIANWTAPGRFVLEILTEQNRYIFKPLEKLQIQKKGSVAVNFADDIDYTLDETYKPGLYLQTEAFLNNKNEQFIDLEHQKDSIFNYYLPMSGYNL